MAVGTSGAQVQRVVIGMVPVHMVDVELAGMGGHEAAVLAVVFLVSSVLRDRSNSQSQTISVPMTAFANCAVGVRPILKPV